MLSRAEYKVVSVIEGCLVGCMLVIIMVLLAALAVMWAIGGFR